MQNGPCLVSSNSYIWAEYEQPGLELDRGFSPRGAPRVEHSEMRCDSGGWQLKSEARETDLLSEAV